MMVAVLWTAVLNVRRRYGVVGKKVATNVIYERATIGVWMWVHGKNFDCDWKWQEERERGRETKTLYWNPVLFVDWFELQRPDIISIASNFLDSIWCGRVLGAMSINKPTTNHRSECCVPGATDQLRETCHRCKQKFNFHMNSCDLRLEPLRPLRPLLKSNTLKSNVFLNFVVLCGLHWTSIEWIFSHIRNV